MNFMQFMKKSRFFTLIELIVVIVVLGILAAIVVPNISSFKDEADHKAILSNAHNIQTAVDMYALEKHGAIPTKDMPTLGYPQTVEIFALKPDYLRDTPKVKGVKYWLDQNNTVWASTVDAPSKVDYIGGKLIWETVDGAELYKIYRTEDSVTTSVKNPKGIKLVEEFPFKEGIATEKVLPSLAKGSYLVTAVDKFDLESAPIKTGVDYGNYKNPDKDFTLGVTQPVVSNPEPIIEHSLKFDGNDYVRVKKAAPLEVYRNFTLETKITPHSLIPASGDINAGANIVSTWGQGGVGNASYYLGLYQGHVRVGFYDGYKGEGYSSNQILEKDKTYFVSAVLEGNIVKIYIDGKLDSTHTATVLPQATNYPLTLGMESNFSYNYYIGEIHNVRVWNKPLQSSEVQKSYLSGTESNLVLYYDFENKNSSMVYDKTSNLLDGTIYGATYIK